MTGGATRQSGDVGEGDDWKGVVVEEQEADMSGCRGGCWERSTESTGSTEPA